MKTLRIRLGRSSRAPSRFMLSILLRGSGKAVLVRALLMIAAIALVDWRVEGNIPLGFLYLIPMLLIGSALERYQIALFAAVCTILTEIFDNYDWFAWVAIPRDILIFAAFVCAGLFTFEVVRSRQVMMRHAETIESEMQARREAEEQLQVLIESSPAGVFTADSTGCILLANEAAHRLFGVAPGSLIGRQAAEFLPSLENLPALSRGRSAFRTVMQCRGRRSSGENFLADVWFSTFQTNAGSRLAAMVVDASEDLRSREELSLNQLLAGSRILVGAVSHEIRNVAGAIAMAHANLSKSAAVQGNRDLEALGSLVEALEKIASIDLRGRSGQPASVDLRSLLEELRIVVEPALTDRDIRLTWRIDSGLPPVWADRQSLMQVFLNLVRNSERALEDSERRELAISAQTADQGVLIHFSDTGPGVAHPEHLFRPFQKEARETGLGLYLSRAFMRSFRGDLRYEGSAEGATFVVELSPAPTGEKGANGTDPDSARGRSRLVSRESEPAARIRT
jgi:two-component system sensor kinase FixL